MEKDIKAIGTDFRLRLGTIEGVGGSIYHVVKKDWLQDNMNDGTIKGDFVVLITY